MAGIMGRVSAYTGKKVTWDEMMNSELKLGPEVFMLWVRLMSRKQYRCQANK